MRTVWKFPLLMDAAPQIVSMPVGAQVLHLAEQHGVPTMWAHVHLPVGEPKIEERHFILTGTGEPIPDDFRTYHGPMFAGPYVFHVWERYVPQRATGTWQGPV